MFKVGDLVRTFEGKISTITRICDCPICLKEKQSIYIKEKNYREYWAEELSLATIKDKITERMLNV